MARTRRLPELSAGDLLYLMKNPKEADKTFTRHEAMNDELVRNYEFVGKADEIQALHDTAKNVLEEANRKKDELLGKAKAAAEKREAILKTAEDDIVARVEDFATLVSSTNSELDERSSALSAREEAVQRRETEVEKREVSAEGKMQAAEKLKEENEAVKAKAERILAA